MMQQQHCLLKFNPQKMIGEKTKFGRLASSKWIKTGLGTKFLDESLTD